MKHTLMELHLLMEQEATLDMVKTITDKYKSKVPPNLKIEFTNYEEKSEKGDYQVEDNTIRLKKRHKNLQDFIETVLHEIHHAKRVHRYGLDKFLKKYQQADTVAMSIGGERYRDNKWEKKAEGWAKHEYKRYFKDKFFDVD